MHSRTTDYHCVLAKAKRPKDSGVTSQTTEWGWLGTRSFEGHLQGVINNVLARHKHSAHSSRSIGRMENENPHLFILDRMVLAMATLAVHSYILNHFNRVDPALLTPQCICMVLCVLLTLWQGNQGRFLVGLLGSFQAVFGIVASLDKGVMVQVPHCTLLLIAVLMMWAEYAALLREQRAIMLLRVQVIEHEGDIAHYFRVFHRAKPVEADDFDAEDLCPITMDTLGELKVADLLQCPDCHKVF